MYYLSTWPSYDFENLVRTYTINSYSVQSTSNSYYLLKMANDPNNLQFIRLWSGVTDTVAQNLNIMYENSKNTADDKNKIKAALLWDSNNVPHLSMGAGYPFLEVKYGDVVECNFSINETGNYCVYGKYGPFNPANDPASEADVLFDITSGSTTTTSNVISVVGRNSKKMKFEVKNMVLVIYF